MRSSGLSGLTTQWRGRHRESVMRLADEITANVGGPLDRIGQGAATSLSAAIALAERFELTPEVSEAVTAVSRSRPSSILSAITYARPPYPKTWVEWCLHDNENQLGYKNNATEKRPKPHRVGAMIEEITIDGLYTITWAWSHRSHGINICPIGIIGSYKEDAIEKFQKVRRSGATRELEERIFGEAPSAEALAELDKPLSHQEAREFAARQEFSWKRYSRDESEISALVELSRWGCLGTSIHGLRMAGYLKKTLPKDRFQELCDAWLNDIRGEGAFIQAFLILVNTKNGVASEREDISRLNRARRKARKAPLHEFLVTRMALSNHAKRGVIGSGNSREQARQHYVRGHFKVRKTGVYWWSPFVRGHTDVGAPRARYVVT